MSENSLEPKVKTAQQALQSLMRLCAKAEKSSGDAMRLMYKWRVSEQDKAWVMEKLITQKFIDDRRYCEAFVREKLNLSGWGAYKISSALKAKGINNQLISEALENLDQDKMRERLRDKLIKKSRSLSSSSDDYTVRSKIIRYGLSLGYSYDMVMSVSDELGENL